MTILDEAITYAVQANAGAYRKGTNTPYILHPLEVAAIVATMTDDLEIIAAAVLHDTVEDTPVSLAEFADKFGHRVADIVNSETENKRQGQSASETWLIRKQETIEHLSKESDLDVKMVALGDKLSNIRAIYRNHLEMGDEVWARFNQHDPNLHGWYYRAIAEVTRELQQYPAWQEYNTLVEKVFS